MIRSAKIALVFLTRLPLKVEGTISLRDLAAAAHLFPLVGLVVGALGGLVLFLAQALGVPPLAAALLGLAAAAALTGALHEDGLADTADALGAHTRARALDIMKDSRIGSYGAVALILAFGLKATALADLSGPSAALALVAAAALGRGLIPAVMRLQPSARAEGLAAAAGAPPMALALTALALGVAVPAVLLPLAPALAALAVALGAGALVAWRLGRRFGGCTGDTLGAVEQIVETAFLLALSAAL